MPVLSEVVYLSNTGRLSGTDWGKRLEGDILSIMGKPRYPDCPFFSKEFIRTALYFEYGEAAVNSKLDELIRAGVIQVAELRT